MLQDEGHGTMVGWSGKVEHGFRLILMRPNQMRISVASPAKPAASDKGRGEVK